MEQFRPIYTIGTPSWRITSASSSRDMEKDAEILALRERVTRLENIILQMSEGKCDQCPASILAEREVHLDLARGNMLDDLVNFLGGALEHPYLFNDNIPDRFRTGQATARLIDAATTLIDKYIRFSSALKMYDIFVSMATLTHFREHHEGEFANCEEPSCWGVLAFSEIVKKALEEAYYDDSTGF